MNQPGTQLDRWIERRDAAAKEVVEAARALRGAWWSSSDMDERERMDVSLLAYDRVQDELVTGGCCPHAEDRHGNAAPYAGVGCHECFSSWRKGWLHEYRRESVSA
ncbi:MAG TPA: hypothetical protein VGS01_12940 [Candidatus Limnocylindria bacterium]|nr:hypothetical protein [Candidatus Limnocylindria bacterium]